MMLQSQIKEVRLKLKYTNHERGLSLSHRSPRLYEEHLSRRKGSTDAIRLSPFRLPLHHHEHRKLSPAVSRRSQISAHLKTIAIRSLPIAAMMNSIEKSEKAMQCNERANNALVDTDISFQRAYIRVAEGKDNVLIDTPGKI